MLSNHASAQSGYASAAVFEIVAPAIERIAVAETDVAARPMRQSEYSAMQPQRDKTPVLFGMVHGIDSLAACITRRPPGNASQPIKLIRVDSREPVFPDRMGADERNKARWRRWLTHRGLFVL